MCFLCCSSSLMLLCSCRLTWYHGHSVCMLQPTCLWLPCVFPECSSAAPSAGKEWEEYTQIRGLVEKIRKKQKGEDMYSHTEMVSLFHDCKIEVNYLTDCMCFQVCQWCLRVVERITSQNWCLGLRKMELPVTASLWPTLAQRATACEPPWTSRWALKA